MVKYIVIDHEYNHSHIFNTKKDVIVGMGGEPGETTFKEVIESGEGVYELIEINNKGELKYLLEVEKYNFPNYI
jgi:hypothetical protein